MVILQHSALRIRKSEIDSYEPDNGYPPTCSLILKSRDANEEHFSILFKIIGAKSTWDSIAFHWPTCGML